MPRILYEVTATCTDRNAAAEWLQWVQTEHLAAVVHCGADLGRVIRLDDGPDVLVAQYEFASRAALQDYLQRHAPRLRAEGEARFADRVVYQRRTGEILAC